MKIKTYIATVAIVYPAPNAGIKPVITVQTSIWDSERAALAWRDNRISDAGETATCTSSVRPEVIDINNYNEYQPVYEVKVRRTVTYYAYVRVEDAEDGDDAIDRAIRLAEDECSEQDWTEDDEEFEAEESEEIE